MTFDAKVKVRMWISTRVMVVSWNQLHGILSRLLSSLRAADGRILVEGLCEDVQEPNERELALVDTYAQRNPEEISRIYGLELPLTRGTCSLPKTFLFRASP